MILGIPRLRMFAGPNGSGKSTFKSMIRKELLGIYVNPDDIEKEIRDFDFLDLAAYSVSTNKEEILSFFKQSTLLERADCLEDAHSLRFNDNSTHEHIWLAEITNGHTLEMKTDQMPAWFKHFLWDKLNAKK
jgi:ABC-type phosphate/phosphonate transport system ATPase subunit